MDETIQRYGKIDALVNNATQGTQGQPIMETSLEEMRSIFETNYFASWHFMTKCYPHMKANGGGSILNICSGAGVLGHSGFLPLCSLQGGHPGPYPGWRPMSGAGITSG